jgi:aspartokinase-like uncharacterized kinase
MNEAGPVVIKVGGSLLSWPELPRRLGEFLRSKATEHLVVVVGGGPLVESIRVLDRTHHLGETRSHSLALQTMDITAHLLASLIEGLTMVDRSVQLASTWSRGGVAVFAPRQFMEIIDARSDAPLPETWETTSDSIAARIAVHLGASSLFLLKSCSPGGLRSVDELASAGLVDPRFPEASRGLAIVNLVNLRENGWEEYPVCPRLSPA